MIATLNQLALDLRRYRYEFEKVDFVIAGLFNDISKFQNLNRYNCCVPYLAELMRFTNEPDHRVVIKAARALGYDDWLSQHSIFAQACHALQGRSLQELLAFQMALEFLKEILDAPDFEELTARYNKLNSNFRERVLEYFPGVTGDEVEVIYHLSAETFNKLLLVIEATLTK